jgi:hypothetical protein
MVGAGYKVTVFSIILPSTKDDILEIKLNHRNQVVEKIARGLGGRFLFFHSSFVRLYTILLP